MLLVELLHSPNAAVLLAAAEALLQLAKVGGWGDADPQAWWWLCGCVWMAVLFGGVPVCDGGRVACGFSQMHNSCVCVDGRSAPWPPQLGLPAVLLSRPPRPAAITRRWTAPRR